MSSRIRKKSGDKKSRRRSSEGSDTQLNQDEPEAMPPVTEPILSTITTLQNTLPGLYESPETPRKSREATDEENVKVTVTAMYQFLSNLPDFEKPLLPIESPRKNHVQCFEEPFLVMDDDEAVKDDEAMATKEEKRDEQKCSIRVCPPVFSNACWTISEEKRKCDKIKCNFKKLEHNFLKDIPPERLEKNILAFFSGDKTEVDLFTYFFDLGEAERITPNFSDIGKSQVDAESNLSITKVLYEQRKYKDAEVFFDKAIINADHPLVPRSFEEDVEVLSHNFDPSKYDILATSYAERSALLFARREFVNCLRDINLCMMLRPSEVSEKLYTRRLKCVEALCLDKIEDFATKNTRVTYVDFLNVFKQCLQVGNGNLLQDLFQTPCKRRCVEERESGDHAYEFAKMSSPPSQALPCFSDAVVLHHDIDKGRHIVAQHPIRPGDTIAREKWYANAMFEGNLGRYCFHCYAKCSAPLPCPFCRWVSYCSFDCLIKEFRGNHLQECQPLSCIRVIGTTPDEIMIQTLTMRILLKLGFCQLRSMLPELREEETNTSPHQKGFNKDGIYDPHDFRTIYHFSNHKNQLSNSELLRMCGRAFVMVDILERTKSYFVDDDGELVIPSREDLINTGATLLRLLCSLPYNFHEVVFWKDEGTELVGDAVTTGVFPSLSLVNHACSSSAELYFDGQFMVLRAMTFIPLGEEITIDYGRTSYKRSVEERNAIFQAFYFSCTCESCVSNWQVFPKLCPLKAACLKCNAGICLEQSPAKCPNCSLVYLENSVVHQKTFWRTVKHLKYAKERYCNVVVKFKKNQTIKAEDYYAITNYIEVMKKYAVIPCKDYYYARANLFRLFVKGV